MANKRRPPSNKIKPGTPHPTKAYTVRGFDGRWVTRKSYNAAKRAREAAKKGGAIVRRTSSAVTKTTKGALAKISDKAGKLFKVKKGDKGLLRGIKDTYKLGQDTKKSVKAAYKAGQITREVHDKLVKGAKDFVGGVREAGKATRRAYEKTKPGGKIVKIKGSKISKYSKPESKIVKSPGGKIVKSPGGKVVKNPGGKVVKSSGGKLTTTRKPQYQVDAKNKASKAKDAARKAARWDKAKMKQIKSSTGSQNIKQEWNPKTKKWENRYGTGTTKPRQSIKSNKYGINARDILNVERTGKNPDGKYKMSRATRAQVNQHNASTRGGTLTSIASALTNPIVDRASHFLYNKISGKKIKFKDYQSKMEALKDPSKPWLVKSKPKNNETSSSAKGWNARNLENKKTESKKKLSNIPAKEGNATLPGRDGKAVRINPSFGKKTDLVNKKDQEQKSNQPKTSLDNKDNNSPKKEKSKKRRNKWNKEYPTIGGKKPTAIQKKLLDAGFEAKDLEDLVDAYDKKYRSKRGW